MAPIVAVVGAVLMIASYPLVIIVAICNAVGRQRMVGSFNEKGIVLGKRYKCRPLAWNSIASVKFNGSPGAYLYVIRLLETGEEFYFDSRNFEALEKAVAERGIDFNGNR